MLQENDTPQDGSLEMLNIDPQTVIPDNVTLSGDAKSVRFNRSKKTGGYVLKEVDEYVLKIIAPSLQWMQERLELRDLEIHKLGELCDQLQLEKLQADQQIESSRMNSMIAEAAHNVTADKEVSALMDHNVALQQQITELQAAVVSGGGDPAQAARLDELTEYANQAQTYIASLEEQVASLQSSTSASSNSPDLELQESLAAAEQTVTELTEYANQAQPYIHALETRIEKLETAIEAEQQREDLGGALAEAQQSLSELTEYANQAQPYIVELERELEAAKTSLVDTADLAAQIAAAKEKEAALEASLSESAATVEELTTYANQAQPYIAELETELEAAKAAGATPDLSEELKEATNLANDYYEHATRLQTQLDEYGALPEQLAAVQAELAEATDLANQYHDYANQLKEQLDRGDISEADSLISIRNGELSAELDALRTAHEELTSNYSQLYTMYEEMEKSIPAEGVVSASDYSTLQVGFDDLKDSNDELAQQNRELQNQLNLLQTGHLEEGVTVEGFTKLRKDFEAATKELKEVKLKYETLRKQKPEESANSESDSARSEEEYKELQDQLMTTIEMYNSLVDQYEGIAAELEALQQSPSSAAVDELTPVEGDTVEYQGRKLPAGLTPEDLE